MNSWAMGFRLMAHSFCNLVIHVVFSTKDWQPLIRPEIEIRIHSHIKKCLSDLDCKAIAVNGTENHLHILFNQNPNRGTAEIIKNIKGNSSHWINQNNLLINKFAWQVGYAAFSVSESQINNVARYICNQKEHHKKLSFKEEWRRLLKLNKI